MSYRPYDPDSEYGRMLAVVERLHDAIATRDAAIVRAILDARSATNLPRGVREEALAIVALPPASFRVPMALLQFHHRLTQLARGADEGLDDFRTFEEGLELAGEDDEGPWDEEQIERADAPADAEPDPAQMEIPFTRQKGPRWSGASGATSQRSPHNEPSH